METEAEFEVATWSQIYAMLLSQAGKIRRSGFKPDVVVGIARGGWIPARVLSDLLEVTDLATVGVEFYVGRCRNQEGTCFDAAGFCGCDGQENAVG